VSEVIRPDQMGGEPEGEIEPSEFDVAYFAALKIAQNSYDSMSEAGKDKFLTDLSSYIEEFEGSDDDERAGTVAAYKDFLNVLMLEIL
jgi:hypothetical protein